MQLDLDKMLDRCIKGQWNVNDFDWSQKPKVKLSKEKEIRVCYYYMNMSYIERLAGALFLALSKRMTDPRLKAIYETFYEDEIRHSHAAAKLMDYFDVHQYRFYTPNQAMLKFIPYFTRSVETLNPAFANSFILGGELILDIALLRSLNEYVDDPMGRAVVEKINQDESRHIAMDFFMTEYCAEHELPPVKGSKKKGIFNPDFRGVLTWGPPFFNEVFFRPMQFMDPEQNQMKEVAKRLRRFYMRPEVQANPVVRDTNKLFEHLESPLGRRLAGWGNALSKATTGIDFGFASVATKDRIRPPKDWDTKEGADQMARALVDNN